MSGLTDTLWQSLPVPAFILSEDDLIAEVNPEGESFLNTSQKSVRGQPVFDILAIDAALDDADILVKKTLQYLVLGKLRTVYLEIYDIHPWWK